jgi:diguanylate cyclase (GGDEF)-like protein
MTGLKNHRAFQERLNSEFQRAVRYSTPLSLLLLDVDHFKNFNDTYGHPAGDQCLRQIARVIEGLLNRPSDLAARHGGEEFACVLPEVDRSGALALAESIRVQVAQLKIPHDASPVAGYVTVSMGVATVVPTPEVVPGVLIAMADQALYRAKAAGRDRVETLIP